MNFETKINNQKEDGVLFVENEDTSIIFCYYLFKPWILVVFQQWSVELDFV